MNALLTESRSILIESRCNLTKSSTAWAEDGGRERSMEQRRPIPVKTSLLTQIRDKLPLILGIIESQVRI